MNTNSKITEEELRFALDGVSRLNAYYETKIIGQRGLERSLIIALIADGHILIESVPGLAKTTAAKAIAEAVQGKFSRIQCTPDLLPSDISGSQIYHQDTGKFETIFGPVFANFVLLDEVNRSSAKTQAAMLEAMQEKQVTIGGETYKMPQDIFTVIATQNPVEQEGTYPLSEAQTDRFMLKEVITYPTAEEEARILALMEETRRKTKPEPVMTLEDIDRIQDIAERVYADQSIRQYIAAIIDGTRHAGELLQGSGMGKYVRIGASPRASIAFLKSAKAAALLSGRTYVTPDDVKSIRYQVLRHRIGLNYAAVADDVTVEQVIDALISEIPTP